ncbi:MAG: hypothetical protein EXR92_01870 [Gemmatimonadetes bacterium]|nr:hypothetical protein [Gemmatimonadota bacterium]
MGEAGFVQKKKISPAPPPNEGIALSAATRDLHRYQDVQVRIRPVTNPVHDRDLSAEEVLVEAAPALTVEEQV